MMRQTWMFLRMWGPVAQLAALLPGVLANVNDEVRISTMHCCSKNDIKVARGLSEIIEIQHKCHILLQEQIFAPKFSKLGRTFLHKNITLLEYCSLLHHEI